MILSCIVLQWPRMLQLLQHYDTLHNDNQHNDPLHDETQHNDTQFKDAQHNDR